MKEETMDHSIVECLPLPDRIEEIVLWDLTSGSPRAVSEQVFPGRSVAFDRNQKAEQIMGLLVGDDEKSIIDPDARERVLESTVLQCLLQGI
ncbi:hypothetical protein Tsubulata_041689 [Turnera subulata]|uniref:Uncharacterized protein n=1 Tax=Turnera subulata TaxID=218843 RepID=A0A9Q0G773_9ROSI|nr:hypothetical protein Tsubulata_041689 [Turnera subulata]